MAAKKQTLKLSGQGELEKLLGDHKWRLNNLYTIKPKEGGLKKFRLNPAQEMVLGRFWFKNYVLKSRQQGISTFSVIYFLDAILFNPAKIAGVIDITDKAARKKLAMAKVAYDNLDNPEVHPDTWELGAMVKRNVTMTKGADAEFPEELVFSNGSAFWAGVSFRGSTLQYALFTEMGKIAQKDSGKAKEIIEGAANSMHKNSIAIYETTHEGGRSGVAYDQCVAAMTGPQEKRKMSQSDAMFHFIPWFVDPDNEETAGQGATWEDYLSRTSTVETVDGPWDAVRYFKNCEARGVDLSWEKKAWYINKRRSQGFGMFKEHPTFDDEPFIAPTVGAIYGHAISRLRDMGRIKAVEYLPLAPVYTFWDLGAPGNTMVWYLQELEGEVRCLRCDYGLEVLTGERVAHMESLGYAFGGHFLPHDGAHKQKGGKTFKAELEEAGLNNVQALPRIGDVHIRIGKLKGYLPEFVFDAELCKQGLVALDAYCWKEDSANPGTFLDKPTDKWPSHASDALGYYAEARMRKLISTSVVGSGRTFSNDRAAESHDMDVGLTSWGGGSRLPNLN
jgi:hypothetical protein